MIVRRFPTLWMLVIVLLLAACGAAAPAGRTTQQLTLTAKEFAYAPAALEVTSGQPVEVSFQNTGAVEHDFSILEIELANSPRSSGEAHGGGGHTTADQPKLHVAAGASASATLTFTPSKSGTYEFYCTVAGHKAAGMVGVLTVK